jgi:hypothetical protein
MSEGFGAWDEYPSVDPKNCTHNWAVNSLGCTPIDWVCVYCSLRIAFESPTIKHGLPAS